MSEKSPMFDYISGFANQLRKGYDFGMKLEKLPEGGFRSAAVCGMGGSAIGADLLLGYAASEMKIPAAVVRGYDLPGWVDENSLTVISSYSGNTVESLSCFEQAVSRGAAIMAITSGGRLEELCLNGCHPLLKIPGGLPPRAALGYSFAPLFAAFERMGFIHPEPEAVVKAADFISRLTPEFARSSGSEPAMTAGKLRGKIPAFYADGFRLGAVVTRFRGQLAENSKTLSFSHLFPELNHNEIVGWGGPEFSRKKLCAVFIWSKNSHLKVLSQMKAAREILSGEGIETLDIQAGGDDFLQEMLFLTHYGDWLSYHLAALYDVDPIPIIRIDALKKKLAAPEIGR